ncbi:MAG: citrate/2-methylcitrate synthase [Clostridia bacterium]|nr:citrate/2-methylcitrate synthase [Clostridia bacterium]
MSISKNGIPDSYFLSLSEEYRKHNSIPAADFERYNVKRGLRNSDGTGVLAGVTQICNVHGYLLNEGERMPINGELTYRGYSIEDLVNNCIKENRFGFEEVAYLLMMGKLPTAEELKVFNEALGKVRMLPDYFAEDMILRLPSRNIMSNLSRAVLALSAVDERSEDNSIENNLRQSLELFARFPIIVAYAYQAKKHFYDKESLYMHFPKPELSTAENILHIVRPDSSYTEEEVHLLDLALMLHAEHGGGNNSTFTTRVLTSSGTDIYSAIAGSVSSLKGPKHGGANIKVVEMMDDIKKNVKNWEDEGEIADYITKILKKQAFDGSGLVYGMGHAIYTLSDPRAVLLRRSAEELAVAKGRMDELKLMDKIAELTPGLFASVKGGSKIICPNVDYYSGFVYSMMDIPVEMYTALFAISRVAGWCAHRAEELLTGGRIIRPAYKSTIHPLTYVPITDRVEIDEKAAELSKIKHLF